jgi:hypothetical protein
LGEAEFVEEDTVVEVAADFGHDGIGGDAVELGAGGGYYFMEGWFVEGFGGAVF